MISFEESVALMLRQQVGAVIQKQIEVGEGKAAQNDLATAINGLRAVIECVAIMKQLELTNSADAMATLYERMRLESTNPAA